MALYNDYRPQDFNDLVGQESLVKILTTGLARNKVAHAYLLAGPRGTGKTTTSRIFAKSLNCHEGLGKICGKCSECIGIMNGNSANVLEIDAASNGSVETVRNTIIERVKFKPTARYRIIYLDECHMLSTSASNALLKVLEEPPHDNIIFIFATTDPQKMLGTILSRVQRFDLKPITIDDIVGRLRYIADKENITVDNEILYMIAKYSKGGMRDAINMLDQLSTFDENSVISRDDAVSVLGMVSEDLIVHIADSILTNNMSFIVNAVDDLINTGKNLDLFYDEMTKLFDVLSKINLGIDINKEISTNTFSSDLLDRLIDFKGKFKNGMIMKTIKILIENEKVVKFSSNKQLAMVNVFQQINAIPDTSEKSSNIDNADLSNIIKRLDELEKLVKEGGARNAEETKSVINSIRSRLGNNDGSDSSVNELPLEESTIDNSEISELLLFMIEKGKAVITEV